MTNDFQNGLPAKQGLYDPAHEKDSCGVGFVAHVKGHRSHQIVLDAATILCNMDHRGACGSEKNTGDGSGMLTAIPYEFFRRVAEVELKTELPEPGKYGVAQIFLPTDDKERDVCKKALEESIKKQGQKLLGWRRVPTDARKADIGLSAAATEPIIEQLFVGAAEDEDRSRFCRELLVIRKQLMCGARWYEKPVSQHD